MSSDSALLEFRGLEKYFNQSTNLIDTLLRRDRQKVQAVDGVSLSLERQESQGIIGESGCGKSTLLMTLIGLYEPTGGNIFFRGRDVADFDKKGWKEFRRRAQIIFQDPFNSLDPKLTVREALLEPLKIHKMGNRKERIRETLGLVELDPPDKYLDRLPHQLSGGEKQRVSIARALIVKPDILLADEPVSMLDVSTQASVLKMLYRLVNELEISMLYISHDLSTVSYVCDSINVMYLGRVIESGPTRKLLEDPKHPYTQALVNAIPVPDPYHDRPRTEIEGNVPDPIGIDTGCRFRERCPERMDICDVKPKFVEVEKNRNVACHLHYDENGNQHQ